MQILTLDNEYFDLNTLPKEIDKDIRYSVLDNSDPKDPDYFFVPLIYLESFSSPAVVLQIGQHQVQMPLEWNMVVGNSEVGDLEVFFYTADLNSVSSTQVAVPKTATSLTNFEVTIPEEFRGENMKVSFFTDTYDSGQGIHYKPFTIPINGLNHATIGSIPVGAGSATGVNNYIAGKILGDRSDSNMQALGYYLWENIQRAKNGVSVGPNPNLSLITI